MFLIQSQSSDRPDADPGWVAASVGKLFCEQCRTINRTLYPQPIDVILRDDPVRTWTTGSPFRVGIPICRREFAEIICAEVPRFVRGRCVLPDGTVIRDYVTLYSDRWVLMRGDEETTTRVCSHCGSIWSDLVMVFRGRPAYLLSHQLTGDSVHQGCEGWYFMSNELVRRVDWSRFRDLRRSEIGVRDTPLDGRWLPGDPDWASWEESGERLGAQSSALPRRPADEKQRVPKKGKPGGVSRAAAKSRTRSSLATSTTLANVLPRLSPAESVLICTSNSNRSDTREYVVPVRALPSPPAGEGELSFLRETLSGPPGVSDFVRLYSKHNGIGMMSPLAEEDPAIALLPIDEWTPAKDEMFDWFFDGVDAAFDGLPYGPDDVLPFAARCHSPDRWFLVKSGPNAGMIHFWGHDGEPMRQQPFARSLAEFILLITAENAPDYFGGIVRFAAGQAAEPRPPRGTELFPVRYRIVRL